MLERGFKGVLKNVNFLVEKLDLIGKKKVRRCPHGNYNTVYKAQIKTL